MVLNLVFLKALYLDRCFFLIYINDLENSIKSHINFFAGDTSLFTIVKDPDISALELNQDLHLISQWAYQWKMSFNPDPTKQAVQVVFTRKSKQIDHPKIYFNDIEVKTVNDHKHLGLILDSKLSFISHINEKIWKAHKGLGIIKSLSRFLSVKTLDLIFKLYIQPILIFVMSFSIYLVLPTHSIPQLTSTTL